MQPSLHCRRPQDSSSSAATLCGKSTPISTLLLNYTMTTSARNDELHPNIHSPEPPSHRCHDHQCHQQQRPTWDSAGGAPDDHVHQTTEMPTKSTTLVRSSSITRITLDRASDTSDSDSDDRRPIANYQEYHERLAVAEALARMSMMTSPAARRRLAARQVEMDLIAGGGDDDVDYDQIDYEPPQQLLMYMVR